MCIYIGRYAFRCRSQRYPLYFHNEFLAHRYQPQSAINNTGETINVSSIGVLHEVQDPMFKEDLIRDMINEAFGVDMNHGTKVTLSTNEVVEGEGAVPNASQEGIEKTIYELVTE